MVIVAWALLVPPFSVPDETAHFSYVQSLAENGERPPGNPPDPSVGLFSTEEQVARRLARNSVHSFDPSVKPAWEPSAEHAWQTLAGSLPRGDMRAIGPQADHPPLYYAHGVVAYAAAPGDDLFDRLFLMRLWSGLLMLVTTAAAWLLIGELVSDRLLQLAGAACVGLQPMATFVSAGVNPDALLFALYAVVLWLSVRIVRRGAGGGALAALLAAALAAALTKPAGLALVPAVVLVLAVVVARRWQPGPAALAVGAVGLSALFVAAGVLLNPGVEDRVQVDLRPDVMLGFATYLWDFYLPRLPFQHDYGMPHGGGGWNLHEQTWAAFGYLEVRFPDPAYVVLAAIVAGTFLAAAVALRRGRIAIDRLTLALFLLTALSLAAGLHWRDFRSVDLDGAHSIQGRYFLPLMPIVGVAVAVALSNLAPRWRPVGTALVLAGMAVLQLFSLSIVAGRFVA